MKIKFNKYTAGVLLLSCMISCEAAKREPNIEPQKPEEHSAIISEDGENYTLSVAYPRTGIEAIDIDLEKFIIELISLFRKVIGSESQSANWKNELLVKYTSGAFNRNIVSYKFEIYEFTGGAHGNTAIATMTYNLSVSILIFPEDIFLDGSGYIDTLASLTMMKLKESLGKSADTTWIARGAGPDIDNFAKFILSPQYITFFFEPYRVAPYAAGQQAVAIPLKRLQGILKDEYKPNIKGNQAAVSDVNLSDSLKIFMGTRNGIEFTYQELTAGGMRVALNDFDDKITFHVTENANSVELGPGKTLIDIYYKNMLETIEDAIVRLEVAKWDSALQIGCTVKELAEGNGEESKSRYVIIPGENMREEYGKRPSHLEALPDSSNGYFEYHSEESLSKFIYVKRADPPFNFDRESIRFIW